MDGRGERKREGVAGKRREGERRVEKKQEEVMGIGKRRKKTGEEREREERKGMRKRGEGEGKIESGGGKGKGQLISCSFAGMSCAPREVLEQ